MGSNATKVRRGIKHNNMEKKQLCIEEVWRGLDIDTDIDLQVLAAFVPLHHRHLQAVEHQQQQCPGGQ